MARPLSLATRRMLTDFLDRIIERLELEMMGSDNLDKFSSFRIPFNMDLEGKAAGDALIVSRILDTSSLFKDKFHFHPYCSFIVKIDKELTWADAVALLHKFKRGITASKNISTDTIVKIAVVEPEHENEKKFKIVLNDCFETPLEGDLTKPSWRLFFDVAKEKEMYDPPKQTQSMNYFNVNKRCSLYTKSGYALTKILKSDDGIVTAAMEMEFLTGRQYKQQLKQIQDLKPA